MQTRFTAFLLCLILASCGDDDRPARNAAPGESQLPAPGAVTGSVTGMPNPGAPTVIPAGVPEPPVDAPMVQADSLATPAVESALEPPADNAGPAADAALAVLRDYFASINARDYARAYAAWRGNPQPLPQFAEGFADIDGISVEIGPPRPVEDVAGQRGVELPVRLEITRADGRMERQSGSYLLHGAIEGGDTQWRIARSSLGPL